MRAFHASLNPNILCFNELSHFGSRGSALAAGAAKYFMPENREAKLPAWLYEVEINLNPSAVYQIHDFGGPTPRYLLQALRDHYIHGNANETHPEFGLAFDLAQKIAYAVQSEIDWETIPDFRKPVAEVVSIVSLRFLCEKLGIEVFEYLNECESPGDLSYAVMNSTQIKICQKTQLDNSELREGFFMLSNDRQHHLVHPEAFLD